jgi:hypothetical protein
MRWIYMAVIWVFAAAVIIFAAQNLEMVAMPFLGFSATQFRHTRQSAASSQLRYELQTGRRSDYLATRSSRKANRNCVGTRLSQTRGRLSDLMVSRSDVATPERCRGEL